MTKLRKLVIDRARWVNGGNNEDAQGTAGMSQLLNDEGNMCCLGFAESKLCGATTEQLADELSPRQMTYIPKGEAMDRVLASHQTALIRIALSFKGEDVHAPDVRRGKR